MQLHQVNMFLLLSNSGNAIRSHNTFLSHTLLATATKRPKQSTQPDTHEQMPSYRPSHCIQVFRREDRPNEQMRAQERASSHDCYQTGRRESRRSSSVQCPTIYAGGRLELRLTRLRRSDCSYRVGVKLRSFSINPGSVATGFCSQFRRRLFNLWPG